MSVHIDEVSTTVDIGAAPTSGAGGDRLHQGIAAAESRLEELRPIVRALVAEEIERWLRQRGGLP